MQTPFSFELVISFGLLSLFLLVGFGVRARLSFFQKYLIPSCLIGGCLGLIILNLSPVELNIEQFEAFTYHFFIISFISVGLTAFAGNANNAGKKVRTAKGIAQGVIWGGAMEGLSVSIQSLIGCSLVFLFAFSGLNCSRRSAFSPRWASSRVPGRLSPLVRSGRDSDLRMQPPSALCSRRWGFCSPSLWECPW